MWKVAEIKATIIKLTEEVEALKTALEKAQRIRNKGTPAPPEESSSDKEDAIKGSDIHAFANNVNPMDNKSTPIIGRQQPPPTIPSTSVLGSVTRRRS